MTDGSARPGFLVAQLVRLACEERDLLAGGDWESALVVRDGFDAAFATLQHGVDRGRMILGPAEHAQLARVAHVNAENLALYEEHRGTAGAELAALSRVTSISGYAPMGGTGARAPRYFDHSA